jgi:hypothetical protein
MLTPQAAIALTLETEMTPELMLTPQAAIARSQETEMTPELMLTPQIATAHTLETGMTLDPPTVGMTPGLIVETTPVQGSPLRIELNRPALTIALSRRQGTDQNRPCTPQTPGRAALPTKHHTGVIIALSLQGGFTLS